MLTRPRIRLPLWSIPVIVLAIYAVRSVVRGSWSPELPMDLVILVMVGVVMVVVARLRTASTAADDVDSDVRGASPSDAAGPPS